MEASLPLSSGLDHGPAFAVSSLVSWSLEEGPDLVAGRKVCRTQRGAIGVIADVIVRRRAR